MRHEPSGPWSSLQPITDRRCPCRAVRPLDDFPAVVDAHAGCCMACRRRTAAVACRRRQRTLRQVARRAEAGYRAMLAQHTREGAGGDAA
jgi:hypothetical protein